MSAVEFYDGRQGVQRDRWYSYRRWPVVPAGLFPENWISSNPQFNQANYYSDSGSSVYHSLQVQGTLRPTHGISFQGTYLWSRSLGISPSSYTHPAEREKDYILQGTHRTHEFRSNGTFELPLGPNKLILPQFFRMAGADD